MTEQQILSQKKYDSLNAVRFSMKLIKKNDMDIIEQLRKQPSMQGYIKDLIRKDLAKDK